MATKKLNLLFIISILISLPTLSQVLDDTYLQSLPEEVRGDILERIDDKDDSEKKTYSSSKASSKIEKEEELIELKIRLEKDLDELEKRLKDTDEIKNPENLVLFGRDFFDSIYSSYMPVNEPNLDSSYILDFGDTLDIQSIGQDEINGEYVINRDGSIFISEIGKLTLSGFSLKEATSLIKSKVKNSFLGTEAFVSLSNIRDISILVSGDAYNPGVYTLNGNSNLLHAVTVAGGINEYGSYRDITLIRDGEVIETLDIYDVLVSGKFNSKKRLRSGDVVFISSVHNIVSIDGGIKRPARYEMLKQQNLSDIINYANGVTNDADLENIFLDRVLDGEVKSLPITNVSQFSSIRSQDGDRIYIRKHSFRNVTVNGAVLKPGNYLMSEGDTVYDLLDKAGGYSSNAFPLGAVFENKDALMVNEMAKEMLYEEFLDNIIILMQQSTATNIDYGPLLKLTEDLKNTPPNGRIVVDLLNDNIENTISLKEGDRLTIPEEQKHIFVYGEVSSEGALLFDFDQNLEDYIDMSGGYKKSADKLAIYILQPNGNTERFIKKRNLFASESKTLKLEPGAIIFVPREVDNTITRRLSTQAYATILGNIGVALASVSSLSD
jgi:protein involved in polysaccharide export with SLBB domain